MPPEPASASSWNRPATTLPIMTTRETRSHHLLGQEDRDRLVINGPAPRPAPVAAVFEAAVRALVGAGVVARTDDGHRAIGQRIAAHALVVHLPGRQAEEARLARHEHVAVVRRFAANVLAELVGLRPQRGMVATQRDHPLHAGGIDAREHAGRHPALAFTVARAVVAPPLGS